MPNFCKISGKTSFLEKMWTVTHTILRVNSVAFLRNPLFNQTDTLLHNSEATRGLGRGAEAGCLAPLFRLRSLVGFGQNRQEIFRKGG